MRRLLRGAVTVLLLAAAGAFPAVAGDDAGARKSLEIGIKAYREGAVEASVEALSGALEEGLGLHESAEALYYRGLAYRALGKPGQAIENFTGAIAVKNGLPPAQLADAEDNRTAAYAEAGISGSESVVVAKVPKRPRTSSAREPKPPSFLTTTSIDPTEPAPLPWDAAMIVPPPPPAGKPTPFATAVLPGAVAPSATAATIVPPPPAGKPTPFATEVLPRAAAPSATAATIVPPPPAGKPTPFATAVLPGTVAPSATAGGIRLQVARVQTQSEAYALAVRLVSQHGAEFGSNMLKIERAVAESKEPVFLVRLGPFANADQAQKRCSALRRGGFDCVVQY